MDEKSVPESYVKLVSTTYQRFSLPAISEVFIDQSNSPGWNVTAVLKQKDYVANSASYFSKHFHFDEKSTSEMEPLFTLPQLTESAKLEAISPSRKLRASIKNITNDSKDEYLLTIWSDVGLNKTLNLTAFDKHGKVHFDGVFGSLQWSQDETKILYVAERKKTKTLNFFELSASVENESNRGEKFAYEENWGELLVDATNPVICVVNIHSETLEVLSVDNTLSPAQPQWGPHNSVVFEGIYNQPYRLGRIYCQNRRSKMCQMFLDSGAVVDINPGVLGSNRTPRVSKDLKKLFFLVNALSGKGDPHMNFNMLMLYQFDTKELRTLYDDDNIPLFAESIPNHCWFDDNVHIVVPNIILGKTYACIINTDSGELKAQISCSALFGVDSNLILSSIMKLNAEMAQLQLTTFPGEKCFTTRKCFTTSEKNKQSVIETGSLTDEYGITSFYVIPGKNSNHDKKMCPLIVYPHGGPHGAHTDNYNQNAVTFSHLGYAVLLANYRGSTGFTKDSLMSLLGKIGTQDVADVHNITLKFIAQFSDKIDKTNVFVYGGSHGGFLGAHLIGQYPDFYNAASLRNPVIDVAAMFMVTDIPDWTLVESGIDYTQADLPTPDSYSTMVAKSPIGLVSGMKAPVLLMIGEKDLRVPPSQGKSFYRLLKGNNKIAKLLLYPKDSHPLSSVETEADSFINTCKWFYKYQK